MRELERRRLDHLFSDSAMENRQIEKEEAVLL